MVMMQESVSSLAPQAVNVESKGYGEALQILMDKAVHQKSVSSPVVLRICEKIQEGLSADSQKIGRLKGDLEKIKRTVHDHEHLKKRKSALSEEYTLLNRKYKALKLEMQGFSMERNQWNEDKYFMEEEIRKLREENESLQGMVDDMTRRPGKPRPYQGSKKGGRPQWQ